MVSRLAVIADRFDQSELLPADAETSVALSPTCSHLTTLTASLVAYVLEAHVEQQTNVRVVE